MIFKSKLGLCKWGHFAKVLHNNDVRKAGNLNEQNLSILFWIIHALRKLMTCVLVLNSITGKNYDFLKLAMGYIFVSVFRGVEIWVNLVLCLSPPNNYIPLSHKPFKSRFLMQKSYAIIFALSFPHLLKWSSEITSHMGVLFCTLRP